MARREGRESAGSCLHNRRHMGCGGKVVAPGGDRGTLGALHVNMDAHDGEDADGEDEGAVNKRAVSETPSDCCRSPCRWACV